MRHSILACAACFGISGCASLENGKPGTGGGGPDGGGPPDSGSPADGASPAPLDGSSDAAASPWQLTWSDEFNGPDGTAPDSSKWSFDVGSGDTGWGNHELEYYTDGTANAVVKGGSLLITATNQGASQFSCWYGACQYVSARLHTAGKFVQQYGRFEARIKIPRGVGVWPAFWMMGQDFPATSWPDCGEIDVMENIGSEPATVHGTTHGPGPTTYVDVGLSGAFSFPGGTPLANDFHLYAMEWEANAIRFYFDDTLYKTVAPTDLPSGATWVWNHPFFLLINFAVGGDWPGSPDATTTWPQTMEVDYVRVYRSTQ